MVKAKSGLREAIFLLRKGRVIAYPTDTAYGLGCDATNNTAVKKIYKIKKRPAGKPLPVIVGSLNLAKKFFKFTPRELYLAKKYWPEALSLILKIKNKKLKMIYKNNSVVVRVPNSKIARFLSSKLGKPIVSTSANISGKGECYNVREILKQFEGQKHRPDLILDVGQLKRRKPSTIIRIINGEIEILRQGLVKLKIKNKK